MMNNKIFIERILKGELKRLSSLYAVIVLTGPRHEMKSAKSFTKGFVAGLDYLRKIIGGDVVSTQVIYDGENNIYSPLNGTVNFRNIQFID